jgi:hypothetical protein
VCLAARDSESRRWTEGADRRICQTFAASPAEPGELPFWFRANPAETVINVFMAINVFMVHLSIAGTPSPPM